MESKVSAPPKNNWKQMGHEETTVAVHQEMKRVQQLPSNSAYATHRFRVLNKILQLLSIQVCIIKLQFAVSISVIQEEIDILVAISYLMV